MKETPLNKAFEDAMRKLQQDPLHQHIARQLEALQQTALDFQEAGMAMTLTVRHRGEGFGQRGNDSADGEHLANGTIDMGDVKLEFLIQKEGYHDDRMSLKVFKDTRVSLDRRSSLDDDTGEWREDSPDDDDEYGDGPHDEWSRRMATDNWGAGAPPDDDEAPAKKPKTPNDIKTVLSKMLIDIRTERDFIGRFNVGPNGVPGNAVDKPFPVAPPLKLKKPAAP